MRSPRVWILGLGVLIAGLIGCRSKPTGVMEPPPIYPKPDYDRPLPEGQSALRKITDPREIPDFTAACGDTIGLARAIAYSLNYLSKPSSRKYFPICGISHEQAVASLQEFGRLVESHMSPEEMNDVIRRRFDVYISVGCDDKGTVLFTGYYTPIFRGSKVRTEEFRYPLYRPPVNLVKGPDGEILGLQQPDGSMKPCPSRRELEGSSLLEGRELVWLRDPFEAYVAHVQGSAVLQMPDGRSITVGYEASNGHEYQSVGKALVRDGKISADELSLQTMLAYFRAHPAEVNKYVMQNPRFVFFCETADSPRGCLNEPVTAFRTIATDKSIFPRACLAFISTRLPQRSDVGIEMRPYTGFALDQDAGGAIRAAGRCDVYMGIGDAAGELAGRTRQEGKLYYLFLKP